MSCRASCIRLDNCLRAAYCPQNCVGVSTEHIRVDSITTYCTHRKLQKSSFANVVMIPGWEPNQVSHPTKPVWVIRLFAILRIISKSVLECTTPQSDYSRYSSVVLLFTKAQMLVMPLSVMSLLARLQMPPRIRMPASLDSTYAELTSNLSASCFETCRRAHCRSSRLEDCVVHNHAA
jgi:hypothetical protein